MSVVILPIKAYFFIIYSPSVTSYYCIRQLVCIYDKKIILIAYALVKKINEIKDMIFVIKLMWFYICG